MLANSLPKCVFLCLFLIMVVQLITDLGPGIGFIQN